MPFRLLQTSLLWAAAMLAARAEIFADEVRLKLSECPAAVQQTFAAESKPAQVERVVKETDGDVVIYATRVAIGGKPYEITVDKDGTLLDKTLDEQVVEREIAFAAAPAEVQKTMGAEADGAELKMLNESKQGSTSFYETGVLIGGKNYWIVVDGRGRLIEKRLGFEIEEEDVDLNDAPPKVQEAFKRIAPASEIGSLRKSTENGKSRFDGVIELGDGDYKVRVDDDGTLLEKSLELEPEEDEIELSETPAAVQRTLRDEARGADIDAVIKRTQGDESLYGISIELGDKAYWIIVDAGGVLVSKELSD